MSGAADRFDPAYQGCPLYAGRLKSLEERFALPLWHSDQQPTAMPLCVNLNLTMPHSVTDYHIRYNRLKHGNLVS